MNKLNILQTGNVTEEFCGQCPINITDNTGKVGEVMHASFSSPVHSSIYDFIKKPPSFQRGARLSEIQLGFLPVTSFTFTDLLSGTISFLFCIDSQGFKRFFYSADILGRNLIAILV